MDRVIHSAHLEMVRALRILDGERRDPGGKDCRRFGCQTVLEFLQFFEAHNAYKMFVLWLIQIWECVKECILSYIKGAFWP
jgi:hypothetical protein